MVCTATTLGLALLVGILLVVRLEAQDRDEDPDFPSQFVLGTYEVVGRRPDANATYTGTAILKAGQDGLALVRTVDGATSTGTGRIETSGPDRTKVLRLRFSDAGGAWEGTYLIASDLDNYARLTGYWYPQTGKTLRPGLEAWFNVPASPAGN
jgi:hypothetical protein